MIKMKLTLEKSPLKKQPLENANYYRIIQIHNNYTEKN